MQRSVRVEHRPASRRRRGERDQAGLVEIRDRRQRAATDPRGGLHGLAADEPGEALGPLEMGVVPFDTADGVKYLSDDLSSVGGTATSASGAFIYFPRGSSDEHTMRKDGVTFDRHKVGSRPGAVLSSIFRPVP